MTRRLVAASAAALAGIVLIGLGQGAIASWFRAIGGGAAIGFAIAVFIESGRNKGEEPESLRKIAERFGRLSIAVIVVCAVAGGVVNAVARKQAADHRAQVRTDAKKAHAEARERAADARARADVVDFAVSQGFWAGRPLVLPFAVKRFGSMLRGAHPPALKTGQSQDVNYAVTRGPASGESTLTVTGLVCTRYALVPTRVSRALGYTMIYRMVSKGRNEIHVVSAGDMRKIGRARWVTVTGLVVAAGPRRDSPTRNTILLMGQGAATNVKRGDDGSDEAPLSETAPAGVADQRCNNSTG